MIIEGILNVVALVIKGIIAILPDMGSFSLPSGFLEWFANLLNGATYFLPIGDFLIMLGIWLVVINFQIIWKIIQRVWDALPFT